MDSVEIEMLGCASFVNQSGSGLVSCGTRTDKEEMGLTAEAGDLGPQLGTFEELGHRSGCRLVPTQREPPLHR